MELSQKQEIQKTNQVVAIKRFKLENLEGIGTTVSALREISILVSLKHPNIVRLLGIVNLPDQLAMIMEFCDMTLRSYIIAHNSIPCVEAKHIFKQMMKALLYCHEREIFHRDIKPENVMINQNGEVKIGDFGMSRKFTLPIYHGYTPSCFCSNYKPFEILVAEERGEDMFKYNEKADIWSTALVLSEMLRGKLFCANFTPSEMATEYAYLFSQERVLNSVKKCFPGIGNDGWFVVCQMLDLNPKTRASAKEVMLSMWMGYD
ncbi:Cell division protein kinase [Entamoeba marina]